MPPGFDDGVQAPVAPRVRVELLCINPSIQRYK